MSEKTIMSAQINKRTNLGNKIFGLCFLLILVPFAFIGFEYYKINYHPEVSVSNFMPEDLLFLFLAGFPAVILIGMLLTSFRFILQATINSKNSLTEAEKRSITLAPITVITIIIVYQIVSIYFRQNPGHTVKDWITSEFFACVYSGDVVLFGSLFLMGRFKRKIKT